MRTHILSNKWRLYCWRLASKVRGREYFLDCLVAAPANFSLRGAADVTVLLSLTVFLNQVSDSMPNTSDAVPLISTSSVNSSSATDANIEGGVRLSPNSKTVHKVTKTNVCQRTFRCSKVDLPTVLSLSTHQIDVGVCFTISIIRVLLVVLAIVARCFANADLKTSKLFQETRFLSKTIFSTVMFYILGTRGAVLHHSAETVMCFRIHVFPCSPPPPSSQSISSG